MSLAIDPIATTLILVDAARLIHELVENYATAHRELALIDAQISIFRTHIDIIRQWLVSAPAGTSRPANIVENIYKAISLVDDAIRQLNADLSRVYSSPTSPMGTLINSTAGFPRMVRARYVLNEEMLRKHLAHLRECGLVLTMALQATQLHSQDEANQQLREVGASVNLIRRGTNRAERQVLRREHAHSQAFKQFLDVLDANEDERSATAVELPASLPGEAYWNESSASQPSSSMATDYTALSELEDIDSPPPYEAVAFGEPSILNASNESSDSYPPRPSSTPSLQQPMSDLGNSKRPLAYNMTPALDSQSSKPLRRKPVGSRQTSESSTSASATMSMTSSRSTATGAASTTRTQSAPSITQIVDEKAAVRFGLTSSESSRHRGIGQNISQSREEPIPESTMSQSQNTSALTPSNTSDDVYSEPRPGLARYGTTELHEAAKGLDVAQVTDLIEQGADVNARDSRERTPLHYAACSSVEVCISLLAAGAQLDRRDANTKKPLFLASEAGQHEIVGLFISRGIDKKDIEAAKPSVFIAIENGHVETARNFVNAGFSFKKLKKDSYKPAALAAKSGSIPMLEFVLDNKASVKEKDEEGRTALHIAAENGRADSIPLLLERGASIKAKTCNEETALHFAVKSGDFSTVEALLKPKNGPINEKDKRFEEDALQLATRSGHVGMFNNLVAGGARLTTQNAFDWQTIHIAAAYGHTSLVSQILSNNDVSVESKIGSPSVKQSTAALVEQGYVIEAHFPYAGSRPLHLAAEFGHTETAMHLIQCGAKVDVPCSSGWRPLHHAAFTCNAALTSSLLAAGASATARTNQNKTPLDLGFRGNGEGFTEEARIQVQRLLQDAMPAKSEGFSLGSMRNALRISRNSVDDKEKKIRAVAQARKASMGLAMKDDAVVEEREIRQDNAELDAA
ncbi:MAG: Ankyrin repeat domain-containing protein 44 [Bogoriella megaspora]|nr:MAG: Ankyrin repeat domain-containing protein 44 [Bogoriella megaspora]